VKLEKIIKGLFLGLMVSASFLYTSSSSGYQAKKREKILIVGSSSLEGFSTGNYPSYLDIAEQKLPTKEFVNKAETGAKSAEIYWRYNWALRNDNYDSVLVNMCVNDIAEGLPVKDCKRRIKKIAKMARQDGMKVYVLNNQPWSGYPSWQRGDLKKVKEFNDYLETLEDQGLVDKVIDFYSAVRDPHPRLPHRIAQEYTTDHLHANTKLGQEKLAEIVVKALQD